jgi:hypothetical protein
MAETETTELSVFIFHTKLGHSRFEPKLLVVSSNPGPAVEIIYHAPLIWMKSMKAKIVEKSPGTVACVVILQRGGWSLRTVGYKIQLNN